MRIAPFDPNSGDQELRRTLEALPDLGLFRVIAHAQTAFVPWLAFSGSLLSSLELDSRLRELAILQVARQEESEYEWVQHSDIALRLGIPIEQLSALERGQLGAPAFDENEQLVLRAVAELGGPGGVKEVTVADLVKTMGVRSTVELVLVVGNYMAIARLLATFAVPIDDAAGLEVDSETRK